MAKYEAAFRERGCESVQDLGGLEEQDMVEIGMKKVEITRLRRLGQQGMPGSEWIMDRDGYTVVDVAQDAGCTFVS